MAGPGDGAVGVVVVGGVSLTGFPDMAALWAKSIALFDLFAGLTRELSEAFVVERIDYVAGDAFAMGRAGTSGPGGLPGGGGCRPAG